MEDCLSKWIDACKKQPYPSGWPGKNHPHSEKSLEKNLLKQILTYNVITNDMENTDGTNHGGNLLLVNKLQIVSLETIGTPQRDQMNRRDSVYISTSSKWAKWGAKI